jgi:hypothetical protein
MNYKKRNFKKGTYKKRNVRSYRQSKYNRSNRLVSGPASNYDSGVALKCFVTKDLLNSAPIANAGNMFVNWGSSTGAAAG